MYYTGLSDSVNVTGGTIYYPSRDKHMSNVSVWFKLYLDYPSYGVRQIMYETVHNGKLYRVTFERESKDDMNETIYDGIIDSFVVN